jgi:hypothetical protein
MKMNKQSQMEIMGLAIVVVLLVLGMLFVVKFILFKEAPTYRKEYTETQLAANMLNTILNTNVDSNCSYIKIGELLQDASKANPDITCTNGQKSDEFVYNAIHDLLDGINQTLKKDYYFKASTAAKDIVELGYLDDYRVRERKTHFLQTDSGVMRIILDIYG